MLPTTSRLVKSVLIVNIYDSDNKSNQISPIGPIYGITRLKLSHVPLNSRLTSPNIRHYQSSKWSKQFEETRIKNGESFQI